MLLEAQTVTIDNKVNVEVCAKLTRATEKLGSC